MNYICLDTCTWIYLANGTEPVKLLDFIKENVDMGDMTILVPTVVIDEWNKHKSETVTQGTIKFFKDVMKSLKRLSLLLGEKGERPIWSFLLEAEEDTVYFEEIISTLKARKEQIEEAITENVQKVDYILGHGSTVVIPTEDRVKLLSGDFALEKKAPFKMKNSFADALIILGFIDYVRNNNIEGGIFVSYNTEDFCLSENKNKTLHPDLSPLFDETKSKFYKYVGEALNTIKENLVSQEELDQIEEYNKWFHEPEYTCDICDGYHGFGNTVRFSEPFEIENQKIPASLAENQMSLDFPDLVIIHKEKNYITTIQIGDCQHCSTTHIKCQGCNEVTSVTDLSNVIECQGCGVHYFFDFSRDYDHIGEYEIILLDDRLVSCAKCGEEFIDEGGTEICEKCEKEYSEN